MNTQEVISTARVPLQAKPSSVLMNMYTAGWGSMQAYYPDSAVSWENVELQVVPLVLEADHRHLKILLHNFDAQPRTVTMRPLELDTGVYAVRIATQRCAPFHLTHRFEPLQLSLPPQATSLVEVRQLTARPLPGPLPDLALSETECLLQRSGDTALLRVRLHNVGIRDSGPARVTVAKDSVTSLKTTCSSGSSCLWNQARSSFTDEVPTKIRKHSSLSRRATKSVSKVPVSLSTGV